MGLSWVACSAKTGVVICDLPGLTVDRISTAICAYTTATASLLIEATTDPDWERGTLPGGAYLVALDGELPKWGAIITKRPRAFGKAVALSLATVEAYMDRRFISDDVSYTDEDQNAIIEDLVDTYVGDSFPIRVEATASATTRDRTYKKASDKSIYSALVELAGVIDGPEWTVGWEASLAVGGERMYTPVLYVADRLGTTPNEDMDPAVTFEHPGPVSSGTFTEDYSSGAGANDVLAVSTAIADVRPESSHAVYADASRPTYELRFTPSEGISDIDTLDEHAEATLARVQEGAVSLALVLDYGTAPKPGVDWTLGDVVGFRVTSPEFPGGLNGTARARGWSMSLGATPSIEPTLTEVTRG
ncbi:MAG: hypothetical protein M0R06_02165 [Sphaerochaeta sp.]|jgi:hypothetical protein|nr:hypothetical protein [Sphaerochaeta sp.]